MFIGFDLGGSKLEYHVFDNEWQVVEIQRISVACLSYQEILQAIEHSINQLRRSFGKEQVIGLATPGTIDRFTGRIRNAPSSPINGHELALDLKTIVGAEFYLVNDANAFVYSEALDGAAREGDVVFGAILGTGVGGGLVVNGELLQGVNGIAGEWGHGFLPVLDFSDYPEFSKFIFQCPCGELNHIESVLSGRGLEKIFKQASGLCLNAEDIVSKARLSDPVATKVFNFYLDMLARSLASVVNLIDPDIIVFGGGMSQVDEIYGISSLVEKYAFTDNLKIKLVPPKYGDASGAKGAAQLAWKMKFSIENQSQ